MKNIWLLSLGLFAFACTSTPKADQEFEVLVSSIEKQNGVQSLSSQIKQARETKGWTEHELGKLVGLSENQVINVEKGIANPTRDIIHKMQKHLDTELVIRN